jgi:tetratricopeptide (TPR) repeat protein
MKCKPTGLAILLYSAGFLILSACQSKKNNDPAKEAILGLNLRKGDVVSCGPPEKEFGVVGFQTACSDKVKDDFDLGMALLHSFEYDEAEKVFAKVIDKEPSCAMAYWGVAMSNYHTLWAPPTPEEFEKGAKAIAIAQSIPGKSARETAYIDAIGAFYKDWEKTPHATRFANYDKAMERLYRDYPDDKEAAVFYSLALTGGASPADKSFTRQKKAGEILNGLYPGQPNHPGVIHYIIHSYDSPELAPMGLDAARKYAAIAPSSAHAQHMPSHIFTRLGLWDENIKSNLIAAASGKCYAENTGIKGNWDEELHAVDYLTYSYLQKGDNVNAKAQVDYVRSMNVVSPMNFKVSYAFAAIPARYLLENKMWEEAATHELHKGSVPWEKHPWQKAIHHFARLLGAVNTGKLDAARTELTQMKIMHDTLINQKDTYKATQVQIQVKSAEAWILFKEGKNKEALEAMKAAAELEDKTEKHPVTPGEVLPARELLGDMLMQMNQPAQALIAYEANLEKRPNRFNSLYGAGLAAERSGDKARATAYYQKLSSTTIQGEDARPEVKAARSFLGNEHIAMAN